MIQVVRWTVKQDQSMKCVDKFSSTLTAKAWQSRYLAENCLRLSIFDLNKNNALHNKYDGTINWGLYEVNPPTISLAVSLLGNNSYIKFSYKQNCANGDEIDIDYRIPLATTLCNYGGVRYWFICPLIVNGQLCGKRVGVLYKPDFSNYFGCRSCFNLTYTSCRLNGLGKRFGRICNPQELAYLHKQIKKTRYKGKLTKKAKKYLKSIGKFELYYSTWRSDFVNGVKRLKKINLR